MDTTRYRSRARELFLYESRYIKSPTLIRGVAKPAISVEVAVTLFGSCATANFTRVVVGIIIRFAVT